MRTQAPLRRLMATAAISAMTCSFTLPAYAVTYTAKQLKLSGDVGQGCDAGGINDSGQISGGCYTQDGQFSVGFVTEPKGKGAADFGLLGGTDSYGFGINNDGVVVGEASLPGDMNYHAVLRRPGDAGLTDLGSLGGSYTSVDGINDSGQIVGHGDTAEGDIHVFIASLSDMRLVDIGGLSYYSVSRAINKKGVIVGYGASPSAQYDVHAFYAKPPHYKFVDMGTFGGRTSNAIAISDTGMVVGYSPVDASGLLRRAFIADINQGGVLRDLGTPAGQSSWAFGVNEHGQVVGQFVRADQVTVAAFVCSGDCADFADLNTVTSGLPEGTLLIEASSINKKGRIVAKGSDNKLYLLTPQ